MTMFYATGVYQTDSPIAADMLAYRLVEAGCDDLDGTHTQNQVTVSYGPFLSTAQNLRELHGDALHALRRLAGRPAGEPTVLNATNPAGTVLTFTAA